MLPPKREPMQESAPACHRHGALQHWQEEGAQAPEPASPPHESQPPAPLQIPWLEQSPAGRPPSRPVRVRGVTIFAKAQRVPLLPLHQDADGTHTRVDEQHAHSGVQEEVDEVPVRGGNGGTVRKQPQGARARPCGFPGPRSRLMTQHFGLVGGGEGGEQAGSLQCACARG